jgi:hypothetical protein
MTEPKFTVGIAGDNEMREKLPNIQKDFIATAFVESKPEDIVQTSSVLGTSKVASNLMSLMFIVDDDAIIDSIGYMLMYDYEYVVFEPYVDFHCYLVFICADRKSGAHLKDGRFTLPICPFRQNKDPVFAHAADLMLQRAQYLKRDPKATIYTGAVVMGKKFASEYFGVTDIQKALADGSVNAGFDVLTKTGSLGAKAFRTNVGCKMLPEMFDAADRVVGSLQYRLEAAKFCPYCAEHMIPK